MVSSGGAGREGPKTNLGMAAAAVIFGGVAMLVVVGHGILGYVVLMPWMLGVLGLYNAVRAQMLPSARRDEIDDRARRGLHFSILSLSISGIIVVIVLMAHVLFAGSP